MFEIPLPPTVLKYREVSIQQTDVKTFFIFKTCISSYNKFVKLTNGIFHFGHKYMFLLTKEIMNCNRQRNDYFIKYYKNAWICFLKLRIQRETDGSLDYSHKASINEAQLNYFLIHSIRKVISIFRNFYFFCRNFDIPPSHVVPKWP